MTPAIRERPSPNFDARPPGQAVEYVLAMRQRPQRAMEQHLIERACPEDARDLA